MKNLIKLKTLLVFAFSFTAIQFLALGAAWSCQQVSDCYTRSPHLDFCHDFACVNGQCRTTRKSDRSSCEADLNRSTCGVCQDAGVFGFACVENEANCTGASCQSASLSTSTFGTTTWSLSLDHKPSASDDSPYLRGDIYLPGDVTSSLNGTFVVSGTNLNCNAMTKKVSIKATTPGFSDFASTPWTTVNASITESDATHCKFSYSVPAGQIKNLFAAADVIHPSETDPTKGVPHYLAVVLSASQDCYRWENRYYIEINEQSSNTSGANFYNTAWNADFGEP